MTAFRRRATRALLRRLAARSGVRLVSNQVPSPGERRVRMLRADAIGVVLDVGANEGQYGHTLRAHGWAGRIVSFEPQSSAYDVLTARARADGAWQARKLAIGARSGAITLNVSATSMSSSILPMHPEHERLMPGTGYIASEQVECWPLEDLFEEYVGPEDRAALKIDVQGFEGQVLAGASGCLERIALIELELCLTELYVGQPRAEALIAALAAAGFGLVGVDPEHVDVASGRTSWANATFRRA